MGPVFVLLAVFCWSFVPFLVKETLPYFAAEWIGALRLLAGGLALLPFAWGVPRRHTTRRVKAVLVGGTLGIAGNYVFYNYAIALTTPSAGNVVVQVEVVGLVILGVVLLRESFGPLKLAGTLLILAGVLLVAWSGESFAALADSRYFRGNLIMLVAGISWSWYGLAQKAVAPYRPGATGTAPMLFWGGVIAAILAVATARPFVLVEPGLLPWVWLVVLGVVCTGASYLFLAWGMARIEASSAALITSMLPVMTIIESWLLRYEPITGWLLVGAGLVVAGVVVIILDARGRNGV